MIEIKQEKLILDKKTFTRTEVEKRMVKGGFNSLARFELFIWNLETFLQLQKKLGDRIILKGGAATQFYIPIDYQRTSVDIDLICKAEREEVHKTMSDIEAELDGVGDYCKFRPYNPKNPKVRLSAFETYFQTVPSMCNSKEIFSSKGKQEIKIDIMYSDQEYNINKIKQPALFAIETDKEFNVLALEDLFADKLTTFGPATIGISDDRADEQFKQIYDVITLFITNMDQIVNNIEVVRLMYQKISRFECHLHGIKYKPNELFDDMKRFINKIKRIERDSDSLQKARDFQSLYLRSQVSRDKTEWAIVGFQLELMVDFIFLDKLEVLQFREIGRLIKELNFESMRGPERGHLLARVRETLEKKFVAIEGLSEDLFRKRNDRIIWELVNFVSFDTIYESVRTEIK